MLETDKCYMLDCDSEIFVWMGKHTSVTERKTSISATEVRIFPPVLFSSPFLLLFERAQTPQRKTDEFSSTQEI